MSIDTLHDYAVRLRNLGMLQVAGDYDYFVAWIKSTDWTGGAHLKPDPAGENTIDGYSNNCPIPFTPSEDLIKHAADNTDDVVKLIQFAKNTITELLNVYTDDIEQTAINAYLDYSNKIITLLTGEEPDP